MSRIAKELERIRKDAGGVLRPADVVVAAKKKSSPLHKCFEWNDGKAALEYRLWQARELIRVAICILEGSDDPIKAYVSLKEDRRAPGGGYRSLEDVLRMPDLRRQLLAEALEELRVYEEKYQRLTELAPVFAAAHRVRSRLPTPSLPQAPLRRTRTRRS